MTGVEELADFLREVRGNKPMDELQRDAEVWRDSPDLNEAWISHLQLLAAELLDGFNDQPEVQYRVVCADDEWAPQLASSLEEAQRKAERRDRDLECGPHRVQARTVRTTDWETL